MDEMDIRSSLDKAAAVAPALRMHYAAAAGAAGAFGTPRVDGAADASGTPWVNGAADGAYAPRDSGLAGAPLMTPGGAAASVVIYLGPAPDVCDANVADSIADANVTDSVTGAAGAGSIAKAVAAKYAANGGGPLTFSIKGAGLFACGRDIDEALRAASQTAAPSVCTDAASGHGYARVFSNAIAGRKTRSGARLLGKIALITGGAQGFGRGIAGALAAQGAYVAVADLNYDGAAECAAELAGLYGEGRAIAVKADVSDEGSVASMVREVVLAYGGLDLFISNAGVLFAGALPEMTKARFDLVTYVNYTGYFLGAKYASVPMITQRAAYGAYTADIIEINSKSGLEGSNKNFAYAGSKFGGIGLTQSFALELVGHGIKVNAICPGNFLDGPLWSDPVKGLFKQYLDAKKVPGATTVGDVRRYYESRVPMNRGCQVEDVAKAVCYLVEQQYETGQALPVTGGQVMLS